MVEVCRAILLRWMASGRWGFISLTFRCCPDGETDHHASLRTRCSRFESWSGYFERGTRNVERGTKTSSAIPVPSSALKSWGRMYAGARGCLASSFWEFDSHRLHFNGRATRLAPRSGWKPAELKYA